MIQEHWLAVYLVGGRLLLGGLVNLGLVATLNGRFVLSPCLWVLARSLLVVSWVSMAASVALLVRSFVLRTKK